MNLPRLARRVHLGEIVSIGLRDEYPLSMLAGTGNSDRAGVYVVSEGHRGSHEASEMSRFLSSTKAANNGLPSSMRVIGMSCSASQASTIS